MKTESKIVGVSKFNIEAAMSWELHNTSLNHELIDVAERELGIREVECTAEITVVGDEFVVTFNE